MDASGCVGFHPIPLHQDVESHHHICQMSFKTAPGQMSHHLAAPYRGHHGEGGFHRHAHVPLSPSADLDVGRVAFGAVKAGIGQDNHPSVVVFQQVSEGLVMNVGGSAVPIGDQAQLVDHDAELAPNDPAVIGLALPARLVEIASRAHRMAQFNAVAVGDAQDGRLGQEVAGPAGLGFQSAEEAGALRQFGEEMTIVVLEPVVESAATDVLDGVEHADGDQFACGEPGLGMGRHRREGVIYFAVEFGDKIGDVHGVPCCGGLFNSQHMGTSRHFQNRFKLAPTVRRPAWKPKPFTIDDYLDHADLGRATVDQRKMFWRWLRGNWKQLRPHTLRRLAMLPVWPNDSGCPRTLSELCEPQNKRIASLMGNALERPSREILSAGMVKNTGRSALTLRRLPSNEEVENLISAVLENFPQDHPLSLEEKKKFRNFENALTVLATVPRLKSALEELGEEYGVALNGEGFLKDPAELVKRGATADALQLPARHVMDRAGSALDRVAGWSGRSVPSSSQIEDALREDGGRIDAHVRRLQEYTRQSKTEGSAPDRIQGVPCIPVGDDLYAPNQIALRGRSNYWGSWKTEIPLTGISAEVQRIYREVGVASGEPSPELSRGFFEWLRQQPAETIADHADQVLRHVLHRNGPQSWESTFPAIPFIPVEGTDGQIRTVTKGEATERRNRIVIPDFEPLLDLIRSGNGTRPAQLAIVESSRVSEPITAALLQLGLQSLKQLAKEPISATGEGNANETPELHFMQVLNALKSGSRGDQLRKRLDRLDLNRNQNKLRTNWRERLAEHQVGGHRGSGYCQLSAVQETILDKDQRGAGPGHGNPLA